jgi:hypothetical protein
MQLVTVKAHHTEGFVRVETYDTDTDAVGGFVVNVSNLWSWLWERRPCRVHLRDRDYWLRSAPPVEQPVPDSNGEYPVLTNRLNNPQSDAR